MVIAGFHDFSSSRIDRQTVPDGYTLGWKSGGVNLPKSIVGSEDGLAIPPLNRHTNISVALKGNLRNSVRMANRPTSWAHTFREVHN